MVKILTWSMLIKCSKIAPLSLYDKFRFCFKSYYFLVKSYTEFHFVQKFNILDECSIMANNRGKSKIIFINSIVNNLLSFLQFNYCVLINKINNVKIANCIIIS